MKSNLDDQAMGELKPKRKHRFVAVLAVLALAAAAILFAAKYVAPRVIETEKLRAIVSSRIGRELGGDAGLHRIDAQGFWMKSSGLAVSAKPPRALSELRVHDLSASFSLVELWRGKWRINHIGAGHLQAAFGAEAARLLDRAEFPLPELVPPAENEAIMTVDVRNVDIARADLFWADPAKDGGQIRGVAVTCFPDGKNLTVHGHGGFFHQAKWPEARISDFKLYYAKPSLRIDEGHLALGSRGVIDVKGEMKFEQDASLDLRLNFARCPITPFLKNESRSKLEGAFAGDTHLQKVVGKSEALTATGKLTSADATVKNVAALEKAATFTGKAELSPLKLDEVRGDYRFEAGKLTVSDFRAESRRVLRVEGRFSYEHEEIAGTFRLGIAPEIAAKFPGAREEVFTRAEGDYVWTTVKISGPLDHPTDDLKPRLIAALEKHVALGVLAPVLKIGQGARDVIELLFPR
ncbi:MAG: AsmA-like C-terminal region-containing protein [Verrucomicrobiota bacterium]|nr:AsmA-like C-terminal region-containing protein [Verrucomicrobiota bacterium]